MSRILLWLGLTLIIALAQIFSLTGVTLVTPTIIAGAIIMVVGLVLLILGK